MDELLQRLRERKLVQWALAYVAGAFALLQGVDIVAQRFAWPEAVERALIVALAIGFFVALVLAWYHGERGAQRVSGVELSILALLLAVGGALLWHAALPVGNPTATPQTATTAPSSAPADRKSIAVLPFENLSDDKANAYFVSGMQDMILTSLSKLSDMKVISRTSTGKYASRPGNLRQVAAELGVAHILEGSVQRDGDQVLINLQLIDAATDTHLWAESFDRKMENVFSVEREVAGLVADALRATLLPAARAALGTAPTRNQAAYDLFLRAEYEARKYDDAFDDRLLRQSIAHYDQAVAADPGFALAFARQAQTQLQLYWDTQDAAERGALAEAALRAAQSAKRLAPDLPDADLALADYRYRVKLDYPGALEAYGVVLAREPRNLAALERRAFALRRLGRFDEAIAAFSAAMEIDPRDSFPCADRGLTNFLAGHLVQAEADFRRALSLNPENDVAAYNLSRLLVYRDGDVDKALSVLRAGSDALDQVRTSLRAIQRRFDEALAVVDATIAAGNSDPGPPIVRAEILLLAGRNAEARGQAQKLVAGLRREVADLPDNSGAGQGARIRLAEVEAILGNEKAAADQLAEALTRLPPEKDPANGAMGLGGAARIYGLLGRSDLLLPVLARIREFKGTDMQTSAANLRLDPVWDKVRQDPGFQAEVVRFADKEAKLR